MGQEDPLQVTEMPDWVWGTVNMLEGRVVSRGTLTSWRNALKGTLSSSAKTNVKSCLWG